MQFEYPRRKLGESSAQHRGRQKRSLNEWNDSLKLELGEIVRVGNHIYRWDGRFNRVCPSVIRRADEEDVQKLLVREAKAKEAERWRAERDAFLALPHVRDARAIAYALEDDGLGNVIDRLTPSEWSELRSKLELNARS